MEEGEPSMSVFDGTVLEDFQENLVMLDKTTTADDYGGIKRVWVDGAKFIAAMTQPQNISAEIAQALTAKKSYKVITETGVTLSSGDYFRRARDGKTFMIVNGNDDRLAPDDSELQMRAATAEETELPKI